VAIRKDAELAEFYRRIYSRHPKQRASQVAIVAVARKLVSRIYCVLKQGRDYRPVETENLEESLEAPPAEAKA
jgi:hypothetical protein